jgi:hypothetical protein
MTSSGILWLNFPGISGSEQALDIRDYLKVGVESRLGLSVPADYASRFPSYKIGIWRDKVDGLIQVLSEIEKKLNAPFATP